MWKSTIGVPASSHLPSFAHVYHLSNLRHALPQSVVRYGSRFRCSSLSRSSFFRTAENRRNLSSNNYILNSRQLRVSPTSQLVPTTPSHKEVTPESSIVDLRVQFDDLSSRYSGNGSQHFANLVEKIFPFKLDKFQLDALSALCNGQSVVLSAPTGAGKTIIGEAAIYLALCRRMRVFYTTPLKALSNQKFYDFKKQFGEKRIGLLTGDVTVNRDADIVVMTTEVYRNMLYAESTEAGESTPITDSLFAVVFDEFHYLNDRDRGTVWEESVIHSPEHVLLVALSATMSNTGDVRDWFSNVQGPTELVTSSDRPVPLKFGYCDSEGITPLFADERRRNLVSKRDRKGFGGKERGSSKDNKSELKLHPKLLRRLKEAKDKNIGDARSRRGSTLDEELTEQQIKKLKYMEVVERNKSRRRPRHTEIPSFPYVVRLLQRREMLPGIIFIFSRAGCDKAARLASSSWEDLVSPKEQKMLRERLDAFTAEHPGLVQKDRIELAMKGISSHHAGLLPLWKICVEELFQDGLIKVVFATETLAAGINMPARTTVISSLSKRTGDIGFTNLTTSEVLQMAGRAGRRGKDTVGHSVILRSRNEGALEAFKVLTAGVDALESKFTPNYGMVLNLLSSRPLKDAKKLVDRSFGNFLRERESIQGSSESGARPTAEDLLTRKREKQALEAVLAEAEDFVKSVDEGQLRSYVKCLERVKAEKRALAYLVQQSIDMDAEMIEDTLTFAPTGTRLLLKDRGQTPSTGAERRQKRREYSAALTAAGKGDGGEELKSFYFGLVDLEMAELESECEDEEQKVVEAIFLDLYDNMEGGSPMFFAVDAHGELRVFAHTAVARLFYEEEPVEVGKYAGEWADVSLPGRSQWKSIAFDQFSAPLPTRLDGLIPVARQWQAERARQERDDSNSESLSGLVDMNRPEILAQKKRVQKAKDMVLQHELHADNRIKTIISAKRAIPKIRGSLDGTIDPYGTKRRKGKRSTRYSRLSEREEDASNVNTDNNSHRAAHNTNWDDFMSLTSVLQHYGFLDDSYNVTSLGSLGAKVRSENELWTSLMLLEPSLNDISPVHLGAVLGASLIENSRPDVYIAQEVSNDAKKSLEKAATERARLFAVQNEFQVEAPIYLDAELMGIVEMWASGISWVELLSNTSLQEGDACRILRRVLDLLRQIQHLPVVSEELKRNAKRAIALLDRFPVTDDRTYVVRDNEREEEFDV